MDIFNRQEMMLSSGASKLIKNAKILVVGVGAGGNEVLKNLLLMGFGNITIVDFDHVEDSNLSRTTLFRKEDIGKSKALVAAERLNEMALHDKPNIRAIHGNLMTDVGKYIFWEHDIVICCVDTNIARAYINDWCVRSNTPFFEMGFYKFDVDISFYAPDGGIIQVDGTHQENFPPKDGVFPKLKGKFPVCLREEIGFVDFSEKRINSCSEFKSKDVNFTRLPAIQVAAAMAGALIATELIKYFDGRDTIRNKRLFYYGQTCKTQICTYNRNPECSIHEEKKIDEIISIPVEQTTILKDFIQKISSHLNTKIGFLYLPEDFIISGKCYFCSEPIIYNKRQSQIWREELCCENCKKNDPDYKAILNMPEAVRIPKEIPPGAKEEYLTKTLSQLGIPENDVLEVVPFDSFKTYYVRNKS